MTQRVQLHRPCRVPKAHGSFQNIRGPNINPRQYGSYCRELEKQPYLLGILASNSRIMMYLDLLGYAMFIDGSICWLKLLHASRLLEPSRGRYLALPMRCWASILRVATMIFRVDISIWVLEPSTWTFQRVFRLRYLSQSPDKNYIGRSS